MFPSGVCPAFLLVLHLSILGELFHFSEPQLQRLDNGYGYMTKVRHTSLCNYMGSRVNHGSNLSSATYSHVTSGKLLSLSELRFSLLTMGVKIPTS